MEGRGPGATSQDKQCGATTWAFREHSTVPLTIKIGTEMHCVNASVMSSCAYLFQCCLSRSLPVTWLLFDTCESLTGAAACALQYDQDCCKQRSGPIEAFISHCPRSSGSHATKHTSTLRVHDLHACIVSTCGNSTSVALYSKHRTRKVLQGPGVQWCHSSAPPVTNHVHCSPNACSRGRYFRCLDLHVNHMGQPSPRVDLKLHALSGSARIL